VTDAFQKILHYCAYQERCHAEVRDKLYSLGLHRNEVEEMIADLIRQNYLNEERFAILYAGGKFRSKHWGKIKIKHALAAKKISDYCVKKALREIDADEYANCLKKMAMQKLATLTGEKNIFVKKRKLQLFLMQKGYEADLINDVVSLLTSKNS
jgi:regulatory protein